MAKRGMKAHPRLEAVSLKAERLVCRFDDGSQVHATLAALGVSPRPKIVAVEPDEFGAGIVLHRSDGSLSSIGADYVLHVNTATYDSTVDRMEREELRQRVAARLKERRGDLHRTQAWMAEKLGLAIPNYSRMESGRHLPDLELLVRAARALGVTLDYFVGKSPRTAAARREAGQHAPAR